MKVGDLIEYGIYKLTIEVNKYYIYIMDMNNVGIPILKDDISNDFALIQLANKNRLLLPSSPKQSKLFLRLLLVSFKKYHKILI